MTSKLEHDIVDYLHAQADVVEVTSTLETIENGLIYLPLAGHGRSPRRLAPMLALASAVLLIVALSVVAGHGDTSTPTGPAAAAQPIVDSGVAPLPEATATSLAPPVSTTPAGTQATVDSGVAALPEATATSLAPSLPTTPAHVPLPGGAVLNGIVPDCTATPDPDVFACTIPAFPEPLGTVDYSGYVSHIVDDTSHVSGGCRATDPDATAYLCYIGSRAVDEQTIGENFLGEWAPREYSAG